MQRLHVLHVISGIDPENGGPTNALMGLTKAQARLDLQVTVAATWQFAGGRDNAAAFQANGVETIMIGPARGRLSRHPDLARVLEQQIAAADVVHIHALFEEIQHRAARIASRIGRPYIIRPCGGLDPWALARGGMKKRLYLAWRLRRDLNQATAIHYTADAEQRAAAPVGLSAAAIVEPNGVDLDEFDSLPPPGRFRQRYPELAGRRIVLFLGRIDYKKGLDLLIPAFARHGAPDSILVLAGPDSGGYMQTVRQLSAAHSLDGRILLPGMLPGAQRLEALVDAELFATTSYVENFGIAIVEALAAGLPVVISDRVNIADSIAVAGVGEVVPCDIDQIGRAIARLQAEPAARATAGARAAGFAREHFDWNFIAARWQDHYRRLGAAASRPT